MIKEALQFTFFTALFLTMFSCGENNHYNTVQEVQEDFKEPTKELTGYYYLTDGGEVEVLKDNFGRFTISFIDYATSINPKNSTFAVHPRTTLSDKFPTKEGEIKASIDVTYTAGYDVEEDVSGNDILGKKRTDFLIKLKDDGKLEIYIEIFSDSKVNNPNWIVAKRKLQGEQ